MLVPAIRGASAIIRETAVFDVDSIGLTNVVSRLNSGVRGRTGDRAPTAFHVGVSVNPAASNMDEELRRFEYKVEAGAEFIVTRPIFDVRGFEPFLKRIEGTRLPVVAGLFPFESARNAEFMANEVPGVHVPDALLDRMRRADGLEAAAREGIAIAREIAAELRGVVQGVKSAIGGYRRGFGSPRWTSLTEQMYSRCAGGRKQRFGG
jgi:homocysteine S-methyltransferase